ncbi:MAG: hypothetical protein A2352_02525 [Caulobacterales bacterium RIFOXYB1_FULL_67_16]|nr:MAG: hypothetical protein A2352_02525 [Caulobacterales bacterium RIFOXYB1_FULL_67_16]
MAGDKQAVYSLSPASEAYLGDVHPNLAMIVRRAIERTDADFTITEKQVRDLKYQAKLVARGTSKTLQSNHRPQNDGLSHAVDLVPYVDGRANWGHNVTWKIVTSSGETIEPYYQIAAAVRAAAVEAGIRVRWGAVWDRTLNDLPATPEGLKQEALAYRKRKPKALYDGPHYELVR